MKESNTVKIRLVYQQEQLKKWGYNDPVILVSTFDKSKVVSEERDKRSYDMLLEFLQD